MSEVKEIVTVRHCTCTSGNPNDHRTIEAKLIKYADGTYGRLIDDVASEGL